MVSTDSVKKPVQPSRKGKRAWRKNIDIQEVEDGLEQLREEKRLLGDAITERSDSSKLFMVDDAPSKSGLKKVGKKPLKVDEILAERSAVPALVSRKRSVGTENVKSSKRGKVQGVTYKELGRLLRVAGRATTGKSVTILKADSKLPEDIYDPWNYEDVQERKKKEDTKLGFHAEHIKLSQTVSFAKAKNVPSTINRPRIVFRESARAVELPEEGKSYNPTLQSWQSLLAREHAVLEKQEKEHKREEERQARIEALGELLDARERAGLDEASSDDEAARSEESNDKIFTEKLDGTAIKRENSPDAADRRQSEKSVIQKSSRTEISLIRNNSGVRKHKLGKHRVMRRPLEVKLSDELTDSMRLIKPEGSVAKDRFISLQERGIIESRVHFVGGRKYKRKVVEKWSYKDFK
ncbi:ribosome biogenesis protein Nop53/GLTSCR2 [Dipodascopsis uninucleata]